MSADAVPAAVPGPNDPPATTPTSSPRPGLLASMLAPVDPARPAFNLTPQAAATSTPTTPAGTPVEGVSSASYHGAEDAPNAPDKATGKGTGSGAQQKGIWRAWMLAGAARWARGGGVQNKRLDAKKAAAQAHQVKETRQVSVNKSGGLGSPSGRTGGTSGAGGKSLGSKSTPSGAVKGPKNSPAGPNRSAGGSGAAPAGGRGGASHGPSRTKTGDTAPKTKPDTGGRPPKPKRDTDPAGPKGAPATGTTPGSPSKPNNSKGPGPAPTPGTKHSDTPTPKNGPTKSGKQPAPTTGKGTTPKGGIGESGTQGKDGKPGKSDQPNSTKGSSPSKTDPSKPGSPTAPTKTDLNKKQHPGRKASSKTGGKPFTTRESRETGYRDGTLAAKTYAHTKAYRDGVKDGWADTTEAADREKTRLDKAHQDRKKAREETPVTPASSTDHHPATDGVQPIKVDRIDATHLHLGNGATRTTVSRGEVRSLKQYERRLGDRLTNLRKVAETTKQLQAHAEAQAQHAQDLLEKARGVKGGNKLAGKLARMHEDAKTQAMQAGEIHKRAVRSADTCGALLANVNTRYADMYQAVIDSPETVPAELAYYQGN